MYGGHITDDWDRRLCVSYLEELMQPDLIDGELQLAPGINQRMLGCSIFIKDNSSMPSTNIIVAVRFKVSRRHLTQT